MNYYLVITKCMLEKDIEKRIVIFFICLIAVLSFTIKPTVWLDLFRYYQYAEEIPVDISFVDYLSYELDTHVDFIYYMILYGVKKMHLPVQLVTCIFCTSYYIQIIYLIEYYRKNCGSRLYSNRISSLMFLSSLMACGPLLFLTISRQLTAICFLLFAIILYLHRKYVLMFLFIVIALMTHVGAFIYLLVFFLTYIFWKLYSKYSIKIVTIKFLYIIPILYAVITGRIGLFILSITSSLLGTILPQAYVDSYLQMTSTSNIIQAHQQLKSALPVLLIYLGTVVLVSIVKRINFITLFTICLSFFMIVFSFSFPFIGQRMHLILPISYYMLLDNIMDDKTIARNMKKISLFIMFGIVCCYLFELFLCRNLF